VCNVNWFFINVNIHRYIHAMRTLLIHLTTGILAFAVSSQGLNLDRACAVNKGATLVDRRDVFRSTASAAGLVVTSTVTSPLRSQASDEKLTNLSNEDLKSIIESDLKKDFLVSADITRAVYDESATFTDEIDTYTMDKWIKGTKALFVAEKSKLDIVGDVSVDSEKAEFRFREDLMFRIPFRPVSIHRAERLALPTVFCWIMDDLNPGCTKFFL